MRWCSGSQCEPDERLGDWANLLFDQAMLAEGAQLADPAGFVRRLNALMFGARSRRPQRMRRRGYAELIAQERQ